MDDATGETHHNLESQLLHVEDGVIVLAEVELLGHRDGLVDDLLLVEVHRDFGGGGALHAESVTHDPAPSIPAPRVERRSAAGPLPRRWRGARGRRRPDLLGGKVATTAFVTPASASGACAWSPGPRRRGGPSGPLSAPSPASGLSPESARCR